MLMFSRYANAVRRPLFEQHAVDVCELRRPAAGLGREEMLAILV